MIRGAHRLALVLLLVGLPLIVPMTAHAGWSSGPDMLQAHVAASATRLHDGTVLMVGGHTTGNVPAGVERFDPATGTWSPTGSLVVPRHSTKAVTLRDGSALAVGGWRYGETGSERYDPGSGAWSQTSGGVEAWGVKVASLPDGRVLAVGGERTYEPTSAARLFDPATGTWSHAADYPDGVWLHTATALADGRVLVVGGFNWIFEWYETTAAVRIYDPATDTWSDGASLPQPQAGHVAERLADGRVLVVGGGGPDGSTSTALLYDPAADSWSPAAPLAPGVRAAASVRLRDGSVLVIGGIDPATGTTASALYDPATDAWSNAGALSADHVWSFTATLLADGRVLVAGGIQGQGQEAAPRSTVELWTPPGTPSEETPPVVSDGLVAPSSLPSLGGTVTISADVVDDVGVALVYAELVGTDGTTLGMQLTSSGGTTYSGTIGVGPNVADSPVSYTVSVQAIDTSDATTTEWIGEIQVDGQPPFDEAPIVSDPTVEPRELPAGGGTVTIQATATDLRGISEALAVVALPGGGDAVVALEGISSSRFEGTFTAPANTGTSPQEYAIEIFAYDDIGQQASADAGIVTVAAPPATTGCRGRGRATPPPGWSHVERHAAPPWSCGPQPR